VIHVDIPDSKVFHEVPCSESPWGSVEELTDEIFDWLEVHMDGQWDYDCQGMMVRFSFPDDKIGEALLFKLVWGGL